ncbi:MAG: hypothetical protein ACKPKQ_04920, partial [Dolichospermum sp.]
MGIFKNITGGDEFSVERKFQQAFNAVFPGLVMATANNCVFTSTDSGLDRRQIIFRFDRRVPEIDTQFSKKLASQTSAFTNYLLNIPESEIIHSLLYKVDESGQAKQNELEALLQTNAVAVWMNNNLAYDPSSEIQIGSDKNNTSQLYGNYHDFSTKSGSNPRSSKEFSPEVIRLGKGSLEKHKTMFGAVIKGVRFCENGGLIESLSNLKNNKNTPDPSYPSYPSCNGQDACATSNTAMMDKMINPSFSHHSPKNPMTGHDGLNDVPSCTRHVPQTTTVQAVEPLQNQNMTGMTGKTEITHMTEQKLRIVIDGKADYYGEVVTIVGFDSKKGTVDIQPDGRKP